MRHGSTPNKRAGRARVLWAVVAAWGAMQAAPARAEGASANLVRAIEVEEAEGATQIRVCGSAEPTFTVFKLSEPPRLVVDLAGADLTGVDRLLEVGQGNVKAVLTTQFSDTAARVGRVTVALQTDGAYDVRSEGNDVVVTVAEAEARSGETAKAEPGPRPEAAPRTEPTGESLPPGVLARRVDRLEAGLRPGDRLVSVTAATEGDATTLTFRTDGPPILIESLQLEHPARLAVDLYGLTSAPRRADTRRVSRDSVVRGVRIGRHSDKVRVVLDLDRRAGTDWTLERTAEGARVVLPHPVGAAPAVAANAPQAEATPVAAAAGLASEGAVHVATSAESQRYSGRRMTLDFKDIDIHNVLRLIAEVSRKNIVVADDVRGTVTLRLANVPWDQALDLVLQSKGLDKEVKGNIIRVAPAAQLAEERQQRLEAQQATQQLEPLRVRIIPVNFAAAGDVSGQIQSVLTDRGSIAIDSRTNSLIVKDIAAALDRAQQLAGRLDTETPQVSIESRIVEANSNFTREVGIQWGGNISLSPVTGNPTGLVFPNVVTMNGAATDGQTPTEGTAGSPNFVVNMPAPIGTNSGGGLGFVFGSVGGAANLNLRLSALENEGVVKTISAPKVTTMDNAQATISSGLSIPFSQVSAAGVNTTFIQAQLQLNVTPHVTADGSVLMEIQVTNNQPNPQLTGANGQPSISTKEARTSVIVKDGETTVIGGIYTRQHSESINAVPWFSKIPVLGWLFKKKNVQEQRTELLVFITPRIVNRSRSIPAGASLN